MSQSVSTLALTVRAAESLPQKRFITIAGEVAGAGESALGVSQYAGSTGQDVAVDVLGTAEVEAGAAVAVGAAVESDSVGRAITLDEGVKLGRALSAAGAAGQVIEVLLIPN